MKSKCMKDLVCLALGICLLALWGCSTAASLTEKVLPDAVAKKVLPKKDILKKRVMILPFVDQVGAGYETTAELTKSFYEELGQSPHLILQDPPDGIFSSLSMESPQYGVVTDSGLIDLAEGLGMNAVMIGVLNPVDVMNRKTGLWPFDKWKRYYHVSVTINVIDTISKTLMITHLLSRDYAIPLDEAEQMDDRHLIAEFLPEALPKLVKAQVRDVEKQLSLLPWTGRILAVEEESIMVPAGKEQGVAPGWRFEVLEPGKAIPSASGRPIHLLGEPIGLIEVTSVTEQHAVAEPVSGGPFKANQLVRPRR